MTEHSNLSSLLLDKISVMRELMLPTDEPLDLLAFSNNPELAEVYDFEFNGQACRLEIRLFEYMPDGQLLFVDREELERTPQEVAKRIEFKLGPDAREAFYRDRMMRDLYRGFGIADPD